MIAKGATVEEAYVRPIERVFECLGRVFRVQSDEEVDGLAAVTSCITGILAPCWTSSPAHMNGRLVNS
jgi:hypothetical protein